MTRAGDQVIWRFMDFTKYVSMLHERALYFTRADHLTDPFEGALSWESARPLQEMVVGERPRKRSTRTLLSCWHRNDHESVAMWRIYSSSQNGVTIRSSVERLRCVLRSEAPKVRLAPVRYLVGGRKGMRRRDPFFLKRAAFDYEREIRAVWRQEHPVAEPGRYLPVDLTRIVERIVVSPASEPWFEGLVRSVSERFGFAFRVVPSELLTTNRSASLRRKPPSR